jgi:hypothetical protein
MQNAQWRVRFAVLPVVGVVDDDDASTDSLLVGDCADDGNDELVCGSDRFFWSTSGLDSAEAAEEAELLDGDFWWCSRASTKDWPLDGGDDDDVVAGAGSVAKAAPWPLALADSVFGLVPKSETPDCASATAAAGGDVGNDAAVPVAAVAVPAVVVPAAKAELWDAAIGEDNMASNCCCC